MAIAALAMVVHTVFSNGAQFGLRPAGSAPAGPVENEVAPDDSAHATIASTIRNLQLPGPIRDPFAIHVKAVVADKAAAPDLIDTVHLSAIWTQDGQTLVLINDHICQGGDEIGRLKIESATQDGVWITHWKGRNFLSIGGNFTLNTPASSLSIAAKSL